MTLGLFFCPEGVSKGAPPRSTSQRPACLIHPIRDLRGYHAPGNDSAPSLRGVPLLAMSTRTPW